MEPERNSPYWGAIVQNNWPVISPGDWHGLETKARDGAAAIDPQEAERARRAFDERVRASHGLEPVKRDMLAQVGTPQAFVDALVAAADTYGRMSDLVYRTRNKILDIVDEATRAIGNGRAEDTDGDGDNSDEEARRVAGIIDNARRAVDERVALSLQELGPNGLPELSLIAEALGLPGPWTTGGPGHSGPPGHWGPGHPDAPGGPHTGPTGPGPGGPGPGGPGDMPLDRPNLPFPLPIQWGPDGPVGPDGRPLLPHLPGFPPGPHTPIGDPNGPSDAPPAAPPVSAGPSPVSAAPTGSAAGYAPAGPATSAGPSHADSGHGDSGHGDGPQPALDDPGPPVHGRTGTSDSAAGEHADGADPASSSTRNTVSGNVISADAANPAMPFGTPMGVVPAQTATPGTVTQAGTATSRPGPTAAAPGGPPDRARSVSAPEVKAPPPVDSKSTPGGSKVPAGSAPPPASASTAAGKPTPVRPQPPDRTGAEDRRVDAAAAPADAADGHEKLREAVGFAMIAASGPSFVVGERVNGDLVLARSLLSSLLAAAESTALGVSWAVSVMRHSGGVSAFVTSNEGRGWLPAGVFLPRELSTPWTWSVSEQAPWEGLADPARILVEFAAAWGVKSGAGLSALVSSEPIDADMLRQLGDIAAEGSVQAAPTMDYSAPASGLEDRLGLVGAPRLLDQVAGVRPERLRGRCLELAVDAHIRVAKMNAGNPATLGAPALRERILGAMQHGRPVVAEWWEELRDTDDLMAASVLPLRADVSRIAVGQLRNEDSDPRSVSGTAAVRALAFERRCNETVLLLAQDPTRQTLRDTVYAHGQIVDHPLFGRMAAAAADQAAARQRAAISTGPDRRR